MAAVLPGIETIFGEALEITGDEERAAFLDRATAGNPELRRQVESLLEAHFRAGRFLEPPTAPPTAPVEPSGSAEGPGTVIGPYKLLQEIGEGGMGAVFMAEQEQPLRRRVALKIIKPGMDTQQVDRPLRGRAPGPGPDGPPEHRPGARRRHHRDRAAVLRDGAGQGRPHHRLLRPEPAGPPTSGWSCSSPSARRSSTPTRRGSSTATSSRPTSWSPSTTASRCPR